jgi:hypothetical protein
MQRYRTILTLLIGLGAVALPEVRLAYPHDHQRPDLNVWFQSLRSKSGTPCCDNGDAEHAEAEWDTTKGGYKVFLKNPQRPDEAGQWFDVPDSAVVEQPNLNGIAMVWWSPYFGMDGRMTPKWRCFIPGAGG